MAATCAVAPSIKQKEPCTNCFAPDCCDGVICRTSGQQCSNGKRCHEGACSG